MALSRLDSLPSILVLDEENIVVPRGKNIVQLNEKMNGGAGLKPRAVLGDISSNRLALTNIFKADANEHDFKKPSGSGRPVAKKITQETEGACLETVKAEPVTEVRPRSFSSQNLEIVDIDQESNPQLVASYVKDIYKYLNELEAKTTIKANYMEGYKIKPSMRAILIDWIVEVHGRFKLLPETLYLTVAIMDRYLQSEPSVVRQELQLVGVTCLFIASKFEEMYCPDIHEFVFIADKAYSKAEILRAECRILKVLDFSLGRPLPLHFLRRFTKAATHVYDSVDVLHHTFSKYLLELSLPEYAFCHHLPSQLAAAALCLSLKVLNENDTPINILWNDTLVYYSGYTYDSLQMLVSKFCSLLIKAETSKCQAIRKKYSVSKFYNISILPHLKAPHTVAFLGKMSIKN